MQRYLRLAACSAAFIISCFAQNADRGRTAGEPSIDRQFAVRGDHVAFTVPGAAESVPEDKVAVRLNNRALKPLSWGARTAVFRVEPDVELGEYQVYLTVDRQQFYGGRLTVLAQLQQRPQKLEVQSPVAELTGGSWWHMAGPGRAGWTLFSTGLAVERPCDIRLLVNGSEQAVLWKAGDAENSPPHSCVQAAANSHGATGVVRSPNELRIANVDIRRPGRIALSIVQGADRPAPVIVTATRWSRTHVLGVAAIAAGFLIALVYWLVSFKGSHIIRGRVYRLRALLMDKETNTYSLSIVQFLLWTAAALFGYTYLAVSKLFVQRVDAIPDVPDVLPGIVGVGLGAGTAILSQAIAQVRPKGSGEEIPSPADLVTSGGAVAPDRIQMLVWTLIGIGVFLSGTITQDPGSINTLPTVPNTLMALMGLSSIGYLGAKFARKPGPNILEISVSPAHAQPAAGSVPAPPPLDVAQPVAAASEVLRVVKAAAAGLSEVSAPAAVKEARTAVASLESGIDAAMDLQSGGSRDGLSRLSDLLATAYNSALRAASEFELVAGSAGSEMARVGASVAQQASAALEDLAGASGQAVSFARAAEEQRAEQLAKDFRRVIELRGANLSPEGLFRARVGVEDVDIPFRMLELRDNRRAPEVVVRDESNPAFARTLRLTIVPWQLEPADRVAYDKIFGRPTKEITFSIFNPDGQKSVKTLELPPGEAQRA